MRHGCLPVQHCRRRVGTASTAAAENAFCCTLAASLEPPSPLLHLCCRIFHKISVSAGETVQQQCSKHRFCYQHLCCVHNTCDAIVEVDETLQYLVSFAGTMSSYLNSFTESLKKKHLILFLDLVLGFLMNMEVTVCSSPSLCRPIGCRQSADWIPVGQLWCYRGADQ